MYLSGYLKQHQAEYYRLMSLIPRFTVERVKMSLGTTFPTANAAVKTLEELGLITETTGNKKNRSFSYSRYIKLLSA
jgi:Fic family protein